MSEALGKIELDVEGPRGPDVLYDIVVPAEWIAEGRRIQIDVPGRLQCAACLGGGCDACGRSGALVVPASEAPVELTLPSDAASAGAVRVRFPGLGAESAEAARPRGQLLLSLRVGAEPSRGIRPCAAGPVKAIRADSALASRILAMVVLVTLLFVFLLWFSGWM